jgi:hypothetical protein
MSDDTGRDPTLDRLILRVVDCENECARHDAQPPPEDAPPEVWRPHEERSDRLSWLAMRARDELREDLEARYGRTAAVVLPDGTVIAWTDVADGLCLVPPEHVHRQGARP